MILVYLIRSDFALVVQRPSLLEKLILRERETERFAVRDGGIWCWDYTQRRVEWRVEMAIRGAAIERVGV